MTSKDSYGNSVNTEKYNGQVCMSQTNLVKILPLINQFACIFGAEEVIQLTERRLPVLKTWAEGHLKNKFKPFHTRDIAKLTDTL